MVPFATAVVSAPAEEPPETKLSARLSQEIRASLPKFVAPSAPAATPADATDPGVLLLPRMEVKEKRLPAHNPDLWLGERAVQQKAMVAYRRSLTDLEWALNSWFVPLFAAPAATRARDNYENARVGAKIDQLSQVIEGIGVSDPAAAAQLQQDLLHDPDLR